MQWSPSSSASSAASCSPPLWGDDNAHFRFILVSDLDHTMVQNEDPDSSHLLQFNRLWCSSGLSLTAALIYSTGRSPQLFKELWDAQPLLTPQVLICSVGTEIFTLSKTQSSGLGATNLLNPNKPPLHQDWLHLPSLTALQGTDTAHSLPAKQYNEHAAWLKHLDGDGWDRVKVLRAASSIPELVLQGSSEQRPHKVSFYLVPLSNGQGDQMSGSEPVLQQLSMALDGIGLSAKVIFSGGVDVDVVPERAGKGNALRFLLREKFGPYYNKGHALWPPLGVQVNGDSGNDEELFEVEHVHGCIVANAKAELLRYAEAQSHEPRIYKASLPCAAGILEGMQHFGVIESSAEPNHDGVETGHLVGITASPSKHIQFAAIGAYSAYCYQPAAGSGSSSMPHTITPALASNIGHSAVALGDFLAAHVAIVAIADLRRTAQEQNFNELGYQVLQLTPQQLPKGLFFDQGVSIVCLSTTPTIMLHPDSYRTASDELDSQDCQLPASEIHSSGSSGSSGPHIPHRACLQSWIDLLEVVASGSSSTMRVKQSHHTTGLAGDSPSTERSDHPSTERSDHSSYGSRYDEALTLPGAGRAGLLAAAGNNYEASPQDTAIRNYISRNDDVCSAAATSPFLSVSFQINLKMAQGQVHAASGRAALTAGACYVCHCMIALP